MNNQNFTFIKRAFIRSYLSKDSNELAFRDSLNKLASTVKPITPKQPISQAPKLDLNKKPLDATKTNPASSQVKPPAMSFTRNNEGKITGYAGASNKDVNRYFKDNPSASPELKKQWDEYNNYAANQKAQQQNYINNNYGGNAAQASATYLSNLYNNTGTAEGRIAYKNFKSMVDKYGYGDPNVISYAMTNMNQVPNAMPAQAPMTNVAAPNATPTQAPNATSKSREQQEFEDYLGSNQEKIDAGMPLNSQVNNKPKTIQQALKELNHAAPRQEVDNAQPNISYDPAKAYPAYTKLNNIFASNPQLEGWYRIYNSGANYPLGSNKRTLAEKAYNLLLNNGLNVDDLNLYTQYINKNKKINTNNIENSSNIQKLSPENANNLRKHFKIF